MKWKRQYEGPFLVIRTPSSVTAEGVRKSAKTRARVVHIDKLKEYVGKPPKSWLAAAQDDARGDDSEAPGEAARAKSPEVGDARGDDSEAPGEAARAKSPEVEIGRASCRERV